MVNVTVSYSKMLRPAAAVALAVSALSAARAQPLHDASPLGLDEYEAALTTLLVESPTPTPMPPCPTPIPDPAPLEPPDLATDVPLTVQFDWLTSPRCYTYRIRLGTSFVPLLSMEIVCDSDWPGICEVGPLMPSTTYYWVLEWDDCLWWETCMYPGFSEVRSFTTEAGMIASPTPVTPPPTPTAMPCCPGDADNSGGSVNANDFLAVQSNFGASNGTGGPGDANCSGGAVDANDFLSVQANFGAGCGAWRSGASLDALGSRLAQAHAINPMNRTEEKIDAIARMRSARDRISAQIAGMTPEEELEWLASEEIDDPFLKRLRDRVSRRAAGEDEPPAGR